jgi:hypothetical protein
MVLAGVEIIIVYASLHLALLLQAEGSPSGVVLHTAALGATALVLTGMLVAGLYGRDQWETVNAHWFHEALRIGLGLFLSAAILIVYGVLAHSSRCSIAPPLPWAWASRSWPCSPSADSIATCGFPKPLSGA